MTFSKSISIYQYKEQVGHDDLHAASEVFPPREHFSLLVIQSGYICVPILTVRLNVYMQRNSFLNRLHPFFKWTIWQWLISRRGAPIMRSVFDATVQPLVWLMRWLSDVTCTSMNMSPRRLTASAATSRRRRPRVAHLIYHPDRSACPHHFFQAPEVSFPVLRLTWIWGNEAWERWIIAHADF